MRVMQQDRPQAKEIEVPVKEVRVFEFDNAGDNYEGLNFECMY